MIAPNRRFSGSSYLAIPSFKILQRLSFRFHRSVPERVNHPEKRRGAREQQRDADPAFGTEHIPKVDSAHGDEQSQKNGGVGESLGRDFPGDR